MKYFRKAQDIAEDPTTEVLVLTEGYPEVGVACRYLQARGVSEDVAKVICFEGNDRVKLFTKTLVKDCESLPRLRSIGVIADSETMPNNRLSAYIEMGEELGYRGCAASINSSGRFVSGLRKFAVSLSPNNRTAGRIEDLILSELRPGVAYNCFSNSFSCAALFGASGMSDKGRVAVLSAALLDGNGKGRSGARQAFEAGKLDVLAKPYATHTSNIDFLLS